MNIQKSHKKQLIAIAGITIIVGIISCGKVTQTAAPPEKKPAFNLTFTVPVVTTQNIGSDDAKVATPSIQNGLDFNLDFYTAVIGASKQGGKTQLSWGKGMITGREVNVSTLNTKSLSPAQDSIIKSKWVYSSNAYDKRGIEIKQSDHTWAKPQFQPSKMQWKVTAQKIEKGYHRFLVSAYSSPSLYRLNWIDYHTVSSNTSLNMDEISEYDTFIAILEIIKMKDEAIDRRTHQQLVTFLDFKLYQTLDIVFPLNSAPSFDFKKPSFQFNKTPLIATLLTLFEFARVDSKSAKIYLKGIKKEVLSKQAKAILIKNLEQFKPISEN